MFEQIRINCMESLESHIEKHPKAISDMVRLVRHLVSTTQEKEEPSRNYLMMEAEFFETKALPLDAREFIAKRVFAFWRKEQLPLLKQNLQCFPFDCSHIDHKSILSLLDFQALSQETLEKLHSTNPICAEKKIKQEAPSSKPLEIMQTESSLFTWEEDAPHLDETKQEDIPDCPIKEENQEIPDLSSCPLVVPISEEEELKNIQVQNEEDLKKQHDFLETFAIFPIELKEYREIILPQLEKLSVQHLPRVFHGIMNRYLYTLQEKYPIMRLKDNLLKNEKTIVTPLSLLVMINHGHNVQKAILQKFSELTDVPELNSTIHKYLSLSLERALMEHSKNFRHTLEFCQVKSDLQRLLSQYPLYKDSLLTPYPNLKIIQQTKNILHEFQGGKADIESILNRHLGPGEANIKRALQKILVKNTGFYAIQEGVQGIHDINSLFKYIQILKEDPQNQKTADILFQMMGTFLRGKQRVPLQIFKTGLNFLPRGLQQKVLFVIKKKLKKELDDSVQKILQPQGKAEDRWRKLLQLLQNPQFLESDFLLFGYPISVLFQKLQNISRQENIERSISQAFPHKGIPENLKKLIQDRHLAKKQAKQKSTENCLRDLGNLSKAFSKGEILSLRHPLVDLFQFYGKFSFSTTNPSYHGYEIARKIARYYQTAQKEWEELPGMDEKIQKSLKKMLFEEKQKHDLKKLSHSSCKTESLL
ncbi:MAG: hypothetical protein HUU50_21940 [Candidatus Brocadiae bacterium]|nr:hypothetical protein [Candidatus Brocadiia bacterium]